MGLIDPLDNPPEVADFNVLIFIEKQILRLDVPMYQIQLMQVLDSWKGLCEEDWSLLLSKNPFNILEVE